MRMVATEIKEFDLRIFVLIDIGVRRLVIRDVIKSHPWRLFSQLIAYEREAGAIEGGPDFFNVIVIDNMRFPHGERVEGHGQNALQRAQAVCGYEESFHYVRPEA